MSDKLVGFLRKTVRFCNVTSICPFVWSPLEKRPRPVGSSLAFVLWAYNVGLTLVNCAFVAVQAVRTLYGPSNALKVYMCFPLVFHLIGGTIQVWACFNQTTVPDYVARYLDFFYSKQVTAVVNDPSMVKLEFLCKVFLSLIKFAILPIPLALACLNLVKPSLPDFWSSLLQSPGQSNLLTRIGFALLQGYITLQTCGNIVICSFLGFPALFYTLSVLKFMRDHTLHVDRYSRFNTEVLKLEELFRLYRGIQMVILEFNATAAVLVICAKLSTLTIVMVCTYGAVRMEGTLSLRLAVIAACFEVYLIIFLLLCGAVHNRASTFLRAIKQQCATLRTKNRTNFNRAVWLRKNLKHTREVHIKVGSAYFIDKTIVLTTFKINLDNTVNFLLL